MDEKRMTAALLSKLPDLAAGLALAGWLAAGGLGGALYFHAVWRNARALRQGGSLPMVMAQTFGRFALMALLLGLAASRGAGPLLATAAGVFLARALVMRRLREAGP
jgi:hypothetical protein